MSGEASALGTGVLADPLVAGIAGALVLVVLLIAFAIVRRPSLLEYLRGGGAGKVNPAAGAVDDDEDAGKPKVTILFGTQTGTAERFSKQLKSDLLSRYGKGNAISVVGELVWNLRHIAVLSASSGDWKCDGHDLWLWKTGSL